MDSDNELHDSVNSSSQQKLTVFQSVVVVATGLVAGGVVHALRQLNALLGDQIRSLYMPFLLSDDGNASAKEERILFAWGAYTGMGIATALGALLLVVGVPQAQGSGLPHLIAYLNGARLRYYSSLAVLLTKFMATSLTVASGLFAGPEGPIIHMGAVIGKQTLRACCRLCGLLHRFVPLQVLHEAANSRGDRIERDFAAVGAGAGMAAAFYAPLTATLFVVEEASSHFSLPLLWHSFTASIIALLTMHACAGTEAVSSYISVGKGEGHNCRPYFLEIVLVAVMAVFGGLLGAAYNQLVLLARSFRLHWLSLCSSSSISGTGCGRACSLLWRTVVEAMLVIFVVVISTSFCILAADAEAQMGGCIPHTLGGVLYGPLAVEAERSEQGRGKLEERAHKELHGMCLSDSEFDMLPTTCNYTCLSQPVGRATPLNPFACGASISSSAASCATGQSAPTHFAPLATLLLQDAKSTAEALLMRGTPLSLPKYALAVGLVSWFLFSALAAGLALPVGLLVPSVVIGASFGRLFGVLLHDVIELTDARESASVASACGQAAVALHGKFRIDVSLFALCGAAAFMGGSGRIRLTLTALCLEMTHQLFLLPCVAIAALVGVTVGDLVTDKGLYHSMIDAANLSYVPRVRPRKQCERRGAGKVLKKLRVRDVMTRGPITVSAQITKAQAQRELLETPEALRHDGFPVVEQDGRLVGLLLRNELAQPAHASSLLVRDIMDRSPLTCHAQWPIERAHALFAAMAPRHVIVLADPNGGGDFAAPVGIITRRDLSVRVEQLPYRHEGNSPRGSGRSGGGESDAPTPLLASDQAADHLSETPAVTDRAAASAVGSQSIELMDANPTTGDAGTKASYAAPPAPASSSVGDAQIEALDRSERGE
jgi:chloride channel 7